MVEVFMILSVTKKLSKLIVLYGLIKLVKLNLLFFGGYQIKFNIGKIKKHL
jgi:hypothetical protein